MSDGVIIAIITSATGLAVALINLIVTLANKAKIQQIGKDVDGKMTLVLEVTSALKKAEGIAEGIQIQKQALKDDREDARQVRKDIIADAKEAEGKTVVEKLIVVGVSEGDIKVKPEEAKPPESQPTESQSPNKSQ